MKIIARSTPDSYETKVWLGDSSYKVIRFVLPENSVDSWRVALEKAKSKIWIREIGEALRAGSVSFFSRFDPDDPDTIIERLVVCKLALAWNCVYGDTLLNLEHMIDSVLIDIASTWPFEWLLREPKYFLKEEWLVELDRNAPGSSLKQKFLANFLPNLDLLRSLIQERVRLQPDNISNLMSGYAALLMAVTDFLGNINKDGHLYTENILIFHRFAKKYLPALWGLLAENEFLSLGERQYYINLLFESKILEGERWSYLVSVLEDLEEEVEHDHTKQHIAETIASLIAQHYLDRYMLHRALHVWEKMAHLKKDRWLQGVLMLHRTPGRWLLFTLLMLGISHRVPWIGISMLLASLLVFLFISIMTAKRFWRGQGFPFLELFLPRLAGAVVVGSSILALENTVWDVSIKMPVFSWAIITATSSLGALAYIFLEVHKTKRLQPLELRGEKEKTHGENMSPLMSRSVGISWRFFLIGALEALGINMLVTAFLPLDQQVLDSPSTFTLAAGHSWRFLAFKSYGVVVDASIHGQPFIHLTFFPKVIILWSGLSLLLGAFAQLLWQDRRITAS